MHTVRTSRHKLPRRPGGARRLARPDGGGDAVHRGRPFADQHGPDMAVVQDDGAASAVHGKPVRSALVRSRLCVLVLAGAPDRCWRVYGKVVWGRLGARQLSYFIQCAIASPRWLVVRVAESSSELVEEALLLVGVAGGEVRQSGGAISCARSTVSG